MKKLMTLLSAFLLLSLVSTAQQNVGIGTTDPQYKLHVSGGDFFFNTATGSFKSGYLNSNQWALTSIGGGSTMLWRSSPDGINFTTRHRFEQNGDVIIGSENPATARLEVKGIGTGSGSTAFKIRDGNDGELMRFQADGKMSIGHTGSLGRQLNINGGINLYKDETNFAGAIAPAATDHLAIFTNYISTSVLELQPAFGVVTIGTTTPATGYILSVDGKAIAEEVKVQISGSWPDYVFKDDYKLMSLSSLRASLKKNGHLPNMPSAQKVNSDNGIELGEMNKKLLEKVEELTLYILGLDARIKAMEEKYEQKK